MRRILAILISASLMNIGVSAYAYDSVMEKYAMPNPAMESDMMKVDMSSPLAKADPQKSALKKEKKNHRHKLKKNHTKNSDMTIG